VAIELEVGRRRAVKKAADEAARKAYKESNDG
jgi:hypothetical protein